MPYADSAEARPRARERILCFNCNDARHTNGGTCPHLDTPVTAQDGTTEATDGA